MEDHYAGEPLLEVFQCTYNLLDQSNLSLGKLIIKEGKQLVLMEVLANGRLFLNTNYPNYKALYQRLEGLSEKYEVGIDAVIMRYCMQTLNGALILSGANKPEHLKQNLKATFKPFHMFHGAIIGKTHLGDWLVLSYILFEIN